MSYVALEFTGTNNFSNNAGPAVQIIGALLDIHNTTIFEQNTVTDISGALLVNSFGQLRVFPQTNLLFDRNSGSFGSSIVVLPQTSRVDNNNLIHNSQCFLLYADQDIPLVDLNRDTVNLTFSHNKAELGSSMFLFTTKFCSWIGNKPPYFNEVSILQWNFTDMIDDKENLSIRTAATTMILPNNVTGWPGQRISVSMQLIDELNFSTSGRIQLMPLNSSDARISIFISQTVQLITPGEATIGLFYRPKQSH